MIYSTGDIVIWNRSGCDIPYGAVMVILDRYPHCDDWYRVLYRFKVHIVDSIDLVSP